MSVISIKKKFFFLLVATLLVGCVNLKPGRSETTRFFVLTAKSTANETVSYTHSQSIGVGPVTIAEYLDKNNIGKKQNDNEIVFSEHTQWAESLDKNINRVLWKNLSNALPNSELYLFPWRSKTKLDKQIHITITQFDATDHEVILEATWTVYARNEQSHEQNRQVTRLELSSSETEAQIETMSEALKMLSNDIMNNL